MTAGPITRPAKVLSLDDLLFPSETTLELSL